ncbi:MAG: DUF2752 domain-containing protein [Muribaculaceae bacterium]|nr:DUF2752 domain-containing protein [Muribaculaceae bacterium]
MIGAHPNGTLRLSVMLLGIIALFMLGALYFAVDPSATKWLPRCPVLMLTGWECPSCGAQRAIHAALHLQFRQALTFNPFMLVSVPYFLLAAYAWWLRGPGWKKLRHTLYSPIGVYIYVALWCAWGIVRNILA